MITISDAAKDKIISILNEEKAQVIRFGLQGGGCNGFTYFLAIEQDPLAEDDFEFPLGDSHKLVIDAASSMYLEEATVDYKKDIMGETFVFNNPNQKSSCGCGNSVGF
jgi:iron-sulfur cluster assembly accessory protein